MKTNSHNRAILLLLLSITTLMSHSQAQKQRVNKTIGHAETFVQKIARGHFDSTYVALPAHKWMVFVSGNGSYTKYHLKVPMPSMAEVWKDWGVDYAKYPVLRDQDIYTYDMDLHNSTQSISLGLAYQTLRAKYTFNVSKGNDRQLSIESLGSRFGFFLDYRHTKRMKGDMYDVGEGLGAYLLNTDLTADQIIQKGTSPINATYNNYTLFHAQAHYVFNSKHFSYSAGRSASRIQLKSAGSPIALVDFYQSRTKFKKDFIIGENEKFKTWKFSLGGGYGYNWTPNAGKFLLHASVMPTVTLFSHSKHSTDVPLTAEALKKDYERNNYTDYTDDDIEKGVQNNKKTLERVNSLVDATPKITLNCTARFSATWNIDSHYVLGAYGTYLYSHFANKQDYRIKEHDFNGSVFVGYRF